MDHTRLLADVKSAEGCRLQAYRDTLGNWTVGYGHLLPKGRDWAGTAWTQDQAGSQLEKDLEASGIAVAQALPEWDVLDTDARQNALCELCFNMGVGHWRAFAETRAAIQRKDWLAASTGLLDSLWAKQVGLRADRLASYLLTGSFDFKAT